MTNGTASNFAKYMQILENFAPGIFVAFDFPPGISGILRQIVRRLEIQQFWNFPEISQEISTLFALVSKVPEVFCSNGNSPSFIDE